VTRAVRAAGAIAAFALATPAAGHAASVSYAEHSTGVAANTADEVFVPCELGKAVGGGVYMSGSSLETEVRSSAPYDSQSDADRKPDDGWSGIGNAGPGDETITGFAICVKGARLRYEKDSKVVEGGRRPRTTAQCDRGWEVVGGGVETAFGNDSPEIVLVRSYEKGASDGVSGNDGWSGIVFNGSNGGPVKATTWATCAKGVKLRKNTSSEGFPTFPNNTQDYMETPACSDGFRLTGGGGVIIGAPAGTEIATLEPRDTGDDGDSVRDNAWRTWFNNESGAAQQRSVFALCSKFK
jgi:hypothetical protein